MSSGQGFTVERKAFTSDMLTTKEAAQAVGLSVNTLNTYRYLQRGPRYVRQGRSIRYRIADLQEWLNATRSSAPVEA